MTTNDASRVAAWLMAVALLAGCGGGGGGNGADEEAAAVRITLSPASLQATAAAEGQSPARQGQSVTATVANLPDGPVYPVIVQDAQVLASDAISIQQSDTSSYTAWLPFNPQLQPGTHRGSLQLHLCRDSACTYEYATEGGTLPYEIVVAPPLRITATVNGVPVDGRYTLRDGDVLALQASEPVSWTAAQGGVIADGTVRTPTTWVATLRYGLSTPGGAGSLVVEAWRDQMPQAVVRTEVSLNQ